MRADFPQRSTLAALAAALLMVMPGVHAAQNQPRETLHPKVKISTSLGDIVVELNAEVAPLTVMNFLQYAEGGFYSGTIFHRVKEYLIQGGGYTPDLEEKLGGLRDAVINESPRGLENVRGTIAMYRLAMRPDTIRSQFFINVKDNEALNRLRDGAGYPVFGKVIDGMDVVDRISQVEVSSHPRYAAGRSAVVPKAPVVIQSISVLDPLDQKGALEVAADFEARKKDPAGHKVRELEKKYGKAANKTPSGLIYIDIDEGKGASPIAGDTVEVEFEAYVLGSPTPFDSSLQRWNRAAKLAYDRLLSGVREGVTSMHEGGHRILVIPPNLAFGEPGMPQKVPPNSHIIYDIKLLGVSRDKPD